MTTGSEHIIGIDLGTTNSVVAIIENGEPVIIRSSEGSPRTPSVVGFQEDGTVIVGDIARRQAATQPLRTISSVKRLIGRLKQEIDEAGEVYPFNIGEDQRGMATIIVDGRAYSPEEISAFVLKKLKSAAEEYLDEPVKKAVITVPAYFDDLQRQATLKAAEIAGLEVMRLINEPTAAAMAYGLNRETQETVAVYDFGGGTFDFSLLDIDNKAFEVLTSTGNSRLGGDDLDMALVDYIADKFLEEHGVDLRDEAVTLRRLKDEAERAKCELSTSSNSVVRLPFIAQVDGKLIHLEQAIRRELLEELIEPFLHETLQWCRQGLKESNLKKSQMTKVILVGGSTRIPLVQELVEDFFSVPPFRGVNPDEVVAIGAATQGAVLAGDLEEVVLLDVTPHTLGIEIKGNRKSVLVEKNSTIPIKTFKTFTTTEENQSFVNIHILQGEEEKASECRSLGKFTLSGIPEAKGGQPRIRVEIFVNSDGVVEISAMESHSGVEQKLITTCSHLNADERRAQHGNSISRRRRRRTRAMEESGTPRRAARPSPAPPAEIPEAVPAAVSSYEAVQDKAGTGEVRADLASSFAEIDLQAPPAPPSPPAKPERASAKAASRKKPVREPEPEPESVEEDFTVEPVRSAPPQPIARPKAKPANGASMNGHAPEIETDPQVLEPIQPQRTEPPVVASPTGEIGDSESFQGVIALLKDGRFDADSCEVYEQKEPEFLAYCAGHEDDADVQSYKVKFLTFLKKPEEARDTILAMRKRWPDAKAEHVELYGVLCSSFPNYLMARRERASLAYTVGDYATAMADLEFAIKSGEETTPALYEDLCKVYERMVAEQPGATLQFKLVKLYLRRGELDEAIVLLQQLVQLPEHRNRANKVMGFCFWQKGLRYLAWQKFKLVPLDEELKDTLYRLALDMETNDELVHAQHILERIYGADLHYRDCAELLKKITYRIGLMQDERYGVPDSPLDESGTGPKIIADRFELIEEINRGSMGIVFKAKDRILDEIVAIKVLNDFLCTDPNSVKRFKTECKSARRLTHSHIVRIHDFYDLEKKVISMEYIEGEDMRAILGRNMTFTEDMVLNYLRQICEAMAYAHRLGIVHRDLKPANIMIDEHNQVKVTDFGIAKVINSAATNTGTMIVGTPLYMSPEQIDGRQIDQRADVYALGIMLYELVTGTPPFHEGNIEYQHLHKPVPPITAGISAQMKKMIFKCVEKDPANRYQSIDQMLAELQR